MKERRIFDARQYPDLNGITNQYDVIVADPCFRYARQNGVGSADRHYETLSLDKLKALPVKTIASANCALLLWAAGPKLSDAIELMTAWGFKYSTIFVTWIKTNKHSESQSLADATSIGLGSWTYPSCELLLCGKRGRPLIHKNKRVNQLLVAPRREHSEKPVEVWPVIDSFFKPGVRVIELFARVSPHGYAHAHDVWGLEAAERVEAAPPADVGEACCRACGKVKQGSTFYPGQRTCKLCYIARQKETNKRQRKS